MSIASLLGILGVAVIYYNKHLNNKPHFTSWHGLLGILTMVFFLTQAIGGIVVVYPVCTFGIISRSFIKKFHIFSGCAIALLGYISFLLALYSNWFLAKISGLMWYCCVMPLCFWVFSVFGYNLLRWP